MTVLTYKRGKFTDEEVQAVKTYLTTFQTVSGYLRFRG